jgi:hypothetical protein
MDIGFVVIDWYCPASLCLPSGLLARRQLHALLFLNRPADNIQKDLCDYALPESITQGARPLTLPPPAVTA